MGKNGVNVFLKFRFHTCSTNVLFGAESNECGDFRRELPLLHVFGEAPVDLFLDQFHPLTPESNLFWV